jgi:hypothetical protein
VRDFGWWVKSHYPISGFRTKGDTSRLVALANYKQPKIEIFYFLAIYCNITLEVAKAKAEVTVTDEAVASDFQTAMR